MGTRDSALDGLPWPACAGRLRTGTSLRSFWGRAGPTARPMQHSWEAVGSPSGLSPRDVALLKASRTLTQW